MPVRDLKSQISRLPEQPGVYVWINGVGETIYVGKARSLRDRVRSYLGAAGNNPRTDALLDEAERLEVIVTDSVVEALALENNLIKQRAPKYNVLLRDDKNYPYLQLTETEAFPRLLVARRVERNGDYYAGPFLPARLARRAMELSHRLFGIRSCNEMINGRRGRPCLEYDIGRCLAPCVAEICVPDAYARGVHDARLFLEGRNEELLAQLQARMVDAAVAERFEQAAQLRDAIRTIQTLQERQQKMAGTELGDRDVFGMKTGPEGAVLQVFLVRRGRVVERLELASDDGGLAASDADVLEAALLQFYGERIPAGEIHVPVELAECEAIEALLSERAGRRVRLVVPRRGDKRGLVDLAIRNAAVAYQVRYHQGTTANFEALETLRVALHLPTLPRRIDCFDISTIQGSETVASMVVCEDGRMKKGEYRKFRVRPDEDAPGGRFLDDYAAIRQVVRRRYHKVLESGGPFPDLVVIDGGKGQLAAAYEGLADVGLANLVAVALAKKEELIFTRDLVDAVAFDRHDPALLLLQKIRDEAHRFAVSFHRQTRSRRDLQSALDEVPGIGPRRRRALLQHFGSAAAVRRATREELLPVVGPRVADAVLRHFGH